MFTVNPRPAEEVSSCVRTLLPYHELPAALVVGTGKFHLKKTVLTLYATGGDQHQIFSTYVEGAAGESDLLVSQLSPSDFQNITTAFKQLIAGFLSRDDREEFLLPDTDLTSSTFRKGQSND